MPVQFPLLKPFETWSDKLFFLPKNNGPRNSTSIDGVVEWVPVPSGQVFTSDGDAVNVHASALLAVQVPRGDNGIPASIITCSIDARWAPGESVQGNGPLIPVLDSAHLRAPSTQGQPYNDAAGFLPKDDGSWQFISLKPEWLHTLTPIVEGNKTTLTTLFEVIGLIHGKVGFPNLEIVYNVTANAIATLVTDGISRIGIHYQAGNPTISACYIDPSDFSSFFSGDQQNPSYTYPRPVGVSAENQTQMKWYVTTPGLSYKADNTASLLSLALLFVYTAMVLAHIGWILWTGYSFEAWKTPPELVLLAKNSSPSRGSLANTCAGVEAPGTWSKKARIRVFKSQKPNVEEEQLHLWIHEVGDSEDGYEKPKFNIPYGRKRG